MEERRNLFSLDTYIAEKTCKGPLEKEIKKEKWLLRYFLKRLQVTCTSKILIRNRSD